MLYVPKSHLANVARERFVQEQIDHAKYWSAELRKIDPHLSLVWVNEHADEPGLVPGRWHIRRKAPNGSGMDWYWPITTENGGYREMQSQDLESLRASDLQNSLVVRDRQRLHEKVQEAERRAKALEREQRRDHMREDVRAGLRVAGDGGLTKRRFLAR